MLPPYDLLLTNARVAAMTGGYALVENAAVAVHEGRIAWMGDAGEAPQARQTHDVKGRLVTPGLIDCHTHLVYAGNRAREFEERLKGKSYAEIARAGGGILSTVRATRAASEEQLYKESEKRLRAFLREGVTSIEIKSGYGLDLETEMKMLRVARRLGGHYPVTVRTTFLGAHALPPEYKDADDYIAHICNDMLPVIAREKLADAVDGFCETIGFSATQIAKIFDAAKALGLEVKLHAEQLSDQGGAALAAKYKALSADHLEHLSQAGVRAMAQAGTAAVLLPGAFYMLKETRKPPMDLLRKHKVPMALASDCNPGTSPVTSLLSVLNMGCILFGLTPEEALLGVTQHAARALGLAERLGTIEPGKAADLALWDVAHPAELSYHLGYNPCAGTVKNGAYREYQT